MIDRREILEFASQVSLQPSIVEKDYVLGWILAGIGQHAETQQSWIFKGGTCLKKVYFETYRFSEDLDFTLRDGRHIDAAFLQGALSEVATWVYERSGIALPTDQVRVEVYENPRGRSSAQARLYYRGPATPGGSLPAIRFDLTADEAVVLDPVRQRVWHPYSDEPVGGIHILCYPFAEVFAEKLRALAERGRPRDLYDVVNLYRRPEAREARPILHEVLTQKCHHKGMPIPSLEAISAYREELEADWETMLRAQLPALPSVESFWRELPDLFRWLSAEVEPPRPPSRPLATGEQLIRTGLGGLASLGAPTSALETIRFAAANHLCVDLDYRDEQGRASTRAIEPYSLRRTHEGHVILHAERADGRGHRAYRVDRILGARVTSRAFTPRFAIELAPSGPQAIAAAPSVRATVRRAVPSGRRTARTGVTYVYECSWCRKRFSRQTQNSKLNPHKDKTGWPCPGRTGWLVDSRY